MIRRMVFSQALVICSGFAYAPNFITKIIDERPPEQPVRTRFPPEPNGYLHLGHAKAISFNFDVARQYGGTCNMRMDDTNPSKEKQEYIDSILEDVKWIQDGLFEGEQPWNGKVRKTSDYFEFIYECAEALIQSGDAYVDSLSAEEMREYRGTLTEPGRNSPYRERSVEESLQMFRDMRSGKYKDGEHVLRAKIAMDSPNINLRDPTLYRIKHESHPETGDQWCIYPMYDFSHPISDAVEHITHSLCTLEFEDHRPFYDWTVNKLLGLGKLDAEPQQIEFSRLNIQSTVLSKRKLIQLVDQKHVNGWDDPRLPTLSGLRRRGLPPAALRLFCERIGISKADSNIAYTILEDCARETMDSTSPRLFCILNPLKVTIANWNNDDLEEFCVDRHPKLDMGKRRIPFGKSLYIERGDFFDTEGPEGEKDGEVIPKGFKRLLPNGNVRLRYAYVIECNEIVRDPETNEPIELICKYLPDTRAGNTPDNMVRVKGIIHWVEASTAMPCTVNQYDRLFSVEEPGKESGDFLKDINTDSLSVLNGCMIEPSVVDDAFPVIEQASSASSSIYPSSLAYQFERSGYFALDKASDTKDNLIFNRVVTLRDTWGQKDKKPSQRNRGTGKTQGTKQTAPVEDIRRVSLKAATILSAEPHPEAESLLVCQVDCGDIAEDGGNAPPRTVVAGLAGKVPIEELIGQKVIAVTNLKPAKMRGIESTAMLLAASDEDDTTVELLKVPESVVNGELVSFEGMDLSQPDPMMKSKGAVKAWERAKAGLKLNSDGEVMYGNDGQAHRMISTAGPIKASTLKDAVIN